MSIETYVINGLLCGGISKAVPKNQPPQYEGRKKRYFENETAEFTKLYARYSSDFIEAYAEGLDPADPKGWGKYMIRMADAVSLIKIPGSKNDDIKIVMFSDTSVNYIPPGSKIKAMGSTWITVNSNNISGAFASAIVRKCNAVWNYLDYYGNAVYEPIAVVSGRLAKSNESAAEEAVRVPKGYFNIICQGNGETMQLNTNSRIILGGSAYRITGYSNFTQEFTGDENSVGLLEFTARCDEINKETDDMAEYIAGGREFSWNVIVSGMPVMAAGTKQTLTAASVRNGEAAENTKKHPINYIWESSDERIAETDAFGGITAVSEGKCVITVYLAQNPKYKTDFALQVTSTGAKDCSEVAFLKTAPKSIGIFDSAVISAAYFENGIKTDRVLKWSFSGASEDSCSIHTDGNEVTIRCFGGSEKPLTVTASCGMYSASIDIGLEGI